MTAETTVETIIGNAIAVSNSAAQAATTFANAAQSAAGGFSSAGSVPNISRPELVIPEFDPTTDFTGDFLTSYNDAIADWDPDFTRQVTSFINKYCPNLIGCLKTSVDSWICAVIQGDRSVVTATGMQQGVEDAIWERGRAREAMEYRQSVDEAVAGYAARGWTVPGGVLIDAVQRAGQAYSAKVSTHSRDVMIKVADVEIENIRFAVGEGVKVRLGMLSALFSYLGTWFKLREMAIDKARALLDAKIRLRESIAAYYHAIIGAAGLMLKYDEIRTEAHIRISDIDMRGFAAHLEARVNAAISAAEAMGKIAAAALSAQNTIAEVSHNTQASDEGA
jgi:hypothetical protein